MDVKCEQTYKLKSGYQAIFTDNKFVRFKYHHFTISMAKWKNMPTPSMHVDYFWLR